MDSRMHRLPSPMIQYRNYSPLVTNQDHSECKILSYLYLTKNDSYLPLQRNLIQKKCVSPQRVYIHCGLTFFWVKIPEVVKTKQNKNGACTSHVFLSLLTELLKPFLAMQFIIYFLCSKACWIVSF